MMMEIQNWLHLYLTSTYTSSTYSLHRLYSSVSGQETDPVVCTQVNIKEKLTGMASQQVCDQRASQVE